MEDTAEAAEELARLQHAAGAGGAADDTRAAPPPVGMANPALSPRASAFQAAAQRCGLGWCSMHEVLYTLAFRPNLAIGSGHCGVDDGQSLQALSPSHLQASIAAAQVMKHADCAGLTLKFRGQAVMPSAGRPRIPMRTRVEAAAPLRPLTGWNHASARWDPSYISRTQYTVT